MQNYITYHQLQASVTSHAKDRIADDPRRILENSDPVAAQLTGWQDTQTLGVRITKRLSI
jgi:hypothetical protein